MHCGLFALAPPQNEGPSCFERLSAPRALDSDAARNDGAAMNEPTAMTPRPTAETTLPVGHFDSCFHSGGFSTFTSTIFVSMRVSTMGGGGGSGGFTTSGGFTGGGSGGFGSSHVTL